MLIVAIPKSASTSLMETLGNCHPMKAQQIFFKNAPLPTGLKILQKYHSDIREIRIDHFELFANRQFLFKQHIPPTSNNLSILRELKKTILLRNPIDIIGAYFRAEKVEIHSKRLEFEGCNNLQEWISKAREIGLMEDLEWFYSNWAREADSYPKHNLIVTYDQFIQSPVSTINSIEKFFNIPTTKNPAIAYKRYSRKRCISPFSEFVKRGASKILKGRSDSLKAFYKRLK